MSTMRQAPTPCAYERGRSGASGRVGGCGKQEPLIRPVALCRSRLLNALAVDPPLDLGECARIQHVYPT